MQEPILKNYQKLVNLKFSGKVESGAGIGRKLGFPTANLDIAPKNLPQGIYVCQILIGDKIKNGVLFFGPRETFGEIKLSTEVHIFDFTGNLLGETIIITPLFFLRKSQKFTNEEELKKAIATDCELAKQLTVNSEQ